MQLLGQSGCKFEFEGATVYVDPYLSSSVQEVGVPNVEQHNRIVAGAATVTDADWVLLTNEHLEHEDPQTLSKLAQTSPDARFVGPKTVLGCLLAFGIPAHRLSAATGAWIQLAPDLRALSVLAAHPEVMRDRAGNLTAVGYLLEYGGERIYFAGDTAARQELIDILVTTGPIHTAFIPVNEHNFFRNRDGVSGNMSVREAFQFADEIQAKQMVPIHCGALEDNVAYPDEIRLLYRHLNPATTLVMRPTHLNMGGVDISVIIRTLNEATHLAALLESISTQHTDDRTYEVVLVDSGSTDGTLEIAERYGCRIHHIAREKFSFGRALNIGCAAAAGDVLVMISGHCVPETDTWLRELCQPVLDGAVDYTYGRQLGGVDSHFSERRIFAKYFPNQSRVPQEGFFCNNANSALLKSAWDSDRFDEELTGLEDMELAQRLVRKGGKIGYVAEASVFHLHNETWPRIRLRFEREALALQKIMPQIHVSLFDTVRYLISSVWKDWCYARKERRREVAVWDILRYRWNQYLGAYVGNHEHRRLSHTDKDRYFFPG
jgi:L-ascorbate metabolism protein UlaG (beta-lactamase superfamily)/glycosyltransferase involved in cell wall biosynthesis